MSKDEIHSLLNQYHQDTCFHSLPGPMTRTESFKQIIELDKKAIPAILEQLRDEEQRGMSFVLLLQTITGDDMLVGNRVTDQIMAVKVSDTVDAWLHWGREQGYIDGD